ncbi:hypothetical protein [Romboutsia sp.]|uniref:hypothetical protein n=1 Tax=Romboutsia sp. TaxID=1965302 RepID=UPI003F3B6C87
MAQSNRLNDTVQYLYNQMLSDGILRDSSYQQIQYILDIISMINDNKIDMLQDIADNIKLFGYKEEDLLPLYSVLLNSITNTQKLVEADELLEEYN